ncbi:hypothetical protein ACFQ2T_10670 [Methylophilus flavus]|uniref:Uncharacterized protein n=1 Tax=Methylophilus flavus TaxID=640084 RepID=A0ABW3PF40_9PROT
MKLILPEVAWSTPFKKLPKDKKTLLVNYLVLWNYFEAKVLNFDSSLKSIRTLVTEGHLASLVSKEDPVYKETYETYKQLLTVNGKPSITTAFYTVSMGDCNKDRFLQNTLQLSDPEFSDLLISLILIISGLRKYLLGNSFLVYGNYEDEVLFAIAIPIFITLIELSNSFTSIEEVNNLRAIAKEIFPDFVAELLYAS